MEIIVRVANNIVVSEQLKASLQALLQQDMRIEPYSFKPDQQLNCLNRINSLHQAFLAIIKAIPTTYDKSKLLRYLAACKAPLIIAKEIPADYCSNISATAIEHISDYLLWCHEYRQQPSHLSLHDYPAIGSVDKYNNISAFLDQFCVPPKLTIDEYQAILSSYNAKLIDAIHHAYFTVKEQPADYDKVNATQLLNKAEQYVIMQNGRNNLATVSRFADKIIVQYEQQITPYLPETLAELNCIKNSRLSITPLWFRQLAPWLQIYLHLSPSYCQNWRDFDADIKDVINRWKHIKSVLSAEHIEIIKTLHSEDFKQLVLAQTDYLSSIKKSLPAEFVNLPYHHQAVIKTLLSDSYEVESHLVLLKREILKLTSDNISQLNHLRVLPYWFLRLEEYEQQLLKSVMNQVKPIEDIFSFVPSRLRTLPLLANAALHYFSILSIDGLVLEQYPARMRFSHFVPRDIKTQPQQMIDLYSDRNLKLINSQSAGNSFLIQTLISPLRVTDYFQQPDLFLEQESCKNIRRYQRQGFNIFSGNHPYNRAKFIDWTAANDPRCMALIGFIKQQLSPDMIAKNFNSLCELDCDFLSQGAYNSALFTMTAPNYLQKMFARLMQIIDACALKPHTYGFDGFQAIVHQAWQQTIELKKANCIVSQNADSEDLTDTLIKAFDKHYSLLANSNDWLAIFTHHLFLASSCGFTHSLAKASRHYGELAQLVCEFEHNALNSPIFSAVGNDCYKRELWISSLANLSMLYSKGLPTGSCASGKDRKAIELMHTDAILLFRYLYGYWPSMNDVGDDRACFVAIFNHLYTTRHQHYHSAQNAPGCMGIKTPVVYLPGDIVESILCSMGGDALDNDDSIASNNEVSDIGDTRLRLKYPHFSYLIAAMQMSEEQRVKLLDQLKIIIGEDQFWSSQTYHYNMFSSNLPKGIQGFKKVFEQGGTSFNMLANIYYELNGRLQEQEEPSSLAAVKGIATSVVTFCRSSSTKDLYTILEQFYKNEQPFDEGLSKLLGFKESIFNFNSASRSASASPCPSPPLPSSSSSSTGFG